jgi:hypothetical protein
MNDYLAHLAARVLMPEAALQPRTLSHFEPAPVKNVASVETGSATAFDESGSEVEPPIFASGKVEARAGVLRTPESPGPQTITGAAPASHRQESAQEIFRPSAAVAAPMATPRVAALEPTAARSFAKEEAPSAFRQIAASPAAAPESSHALAANAGEKRTLQPATVALAAEPILPAPPTARVSAQPAPRSVAKTPEPPALLGSPLRVPLPRAVAAASEAEPPPAIHVTIGRLEIRAIIPTASAPRAQPKRADSPSLEDYLRKRSGGGAR